MAKAKTAQASKAAFSTKTSDKKKPSVAKRSAAGSAVDHAISGGKLGSTDDDQVANSQSSYESDRAAAVETNLGETQTLRELLKSTGWS
jgi:hypothetical protein